MHCTQICVSPPFNLLDAYGSQPGGPVGAGYCAFVQDGQDPVRGDGERVDKEVRISLSFLCNTLFTPHVTSGMPCSRLTMDIATMRLHAQWLSRSSWVYGVSMIS